MHLPAPLRALLDRPEHARRLGPFVLVLQLGRGGFAPVWLAREIYSGVELRRVAIKLFAFDEQAPADGAPADARRRRVIEEARLLCRVEHPNIVRFYRLLVDEEPGVLGLVMEHIDGASLEQRLRHGPLPLDEVLAAGAAVASALSAVHGARLVHRDVKPANIVEAHGITKLIDFGIALPRRRQGGAPLPGHRTNLPDLGPEFVGVDMSTLPASIASFHGGTPSDLPAGTFGYIDPVCIAEGVPAVPASDLYALGATLFQCLTGLLPSVAAAGSGGGLKGEVLDGRAPSPPLAELAPHAPIGLCRLVDALLAPTREARPESAEYVAAQIEHLRAARAGQDRRIAPEGGAVLHAAEVASGDATVAAAAVEEAQARYFDYLAAECSEIQLDGLPADQEVGSRRLRLERLFVPLMLTSAAPTEAAEPGSPHQRELGAEGTPPQSPGLERGERTSLGQALAEHPRLAVLGPPGSGKSTLLKSLAVAYAFPERRPLLDQELPDRPWLPILIRCRDLGELITQPIPGILESIPGRALMDARLTPAFAALVRRALGAGQLLLLIDGLDEVADDSRRTTFVRNLRTFLAMYPSVSAVVTSREAGFRIVAGALAAECRVVRIADFGSTDIQRLTVAWYREVLGDRPTVIADAERLAHTITTNSRILLLAKNPLLLMTLLLVNRWLGQIPTKRAALYEKAIEVLLMSWNVEVHGKLDPEEVLPQLAFVAFWMMQQGVQRIPEPVLRGLLQQAREQMPDIFAYTRLGVGELIERVEYRSSLLVQAGKELIDGRLWELYEFRHLTFQEHLAALAAVRQYHPEQGDPGDLASLLRPHFRDQRWREVIPLAAVLAGRGAKPLIEALMEECEQAYLAAHRVTIELARVLWQCLIDEVQIPPPLLDRALLALLRAAPMRLKWAPLAEGRYGQPLRRAIEHLCYRPPIAFSQMWPLAVVTGQQLMISWSTPGDQAHAALLALFEGGNTIEMAGAAAVMAWLPLVHTAGYGDPAQRLGDPPWKSSIMPLAERLVPLLCSDLPVLQYAACDTLRRLALDSTVHLSKIDAVIPRLAELWSSSPWEEIQGAAGSAIWLLVIKERPRLPRGDVSPELREAITYADDAQETEKQLIAASLAYFYRCPWSDDELAERIVALRPSISKSFSPHIWRMLESLGPSGTFSPASADEPA